MSVVRAVTVMRDFGIDEQHQALPYRAAATPSTV